VAGAGAGVAKRGITQHVFSLGNVKKYPPVSASNSSGGLLLFFEPPSHAVGLFFLRSVFSLPF